MNFIELNLLCCLLLFLQYCILYLQTRMSVRSGTLALMLATTQWAPTTALVPEASPSQLMAGPVKVHNSQTCTSQNQCC